MYMTFATSAS